jgi:hypothetical protein
MYKNVDREFTYMFNMSDAKFHMLGYGGSPVTSLNQGAARK